MDWMICYSKKIHPHSLSLMFFSGFIKRANCWNTPVLLTYWKSIFLLIGAVDTCPVRIWNRYSAWYMASRSNRQNRHPTLVVLLAWIFPCQAWYLSNKTPKSKGLNRGWVGYRCHEEKERPARVRHKRPARKGAPSSPTRFEQWPILKMCFQTVFLILASSSIRGGKKKETYQLRRCFIQILPHSYSADLSIIPSYTLYDAA